MKTIRIILVALVAILIVTALIALIIALATHPESAIVWGDVATWVTGLTTIALFIIGFIQIRNEREARNKSEQALANHIKREQAERISCWLEKITWSDRKQWIAIMNYSNQPLYSVIVTLVVLTQDGALVAEDSRKCIYVVPPGLGYININMMDGGMHKRPGIEIAFSDILGNHWVRKHNGELLQLEKTPIRHYNVDLPTLWDGIYKELPPEQIIS